MLRSKVPATTRRLEKTHEAPWVILATGTIDPKGMRFTARSSPELRRNDYAESLRQWCRIADVPIVFCENSGADLHPLRKALGADEERIEWLGFTAPDFPEHRGKGYGEALILRHALDYSSIIDDQTHVVKITGRLFVENFTAIHRDLAKRSSDIACDLSLSTLSYCDSRLFVAKPAFFRHYLLPESEHMSEDAEPIVNFERVLARAALRAVADGMSWQTLPHPPRYQGFSGTFGHAYRNRLFAVREAARWLRAKADRYV